MKQHDVSAKKPRNRFSFSNVNGLLIVAAVLTVTIMLAGNTQARLQQTAAELLYTGRRVKGCTWWWRGAPRKNWRRWWRASRRPVAPRPR